MITKNREKQIRSLQHKKYRDKDGLFIVEGRKVVNDLILSGKFIIDEIFTSDSCFNETFETSVISVSEMRKISNLNNPSDVLAVVRKNEDRVHISGFGGSLYLDNIQDPGNLGTIIRTANWFGFKQIICSKDSVDYLNPKAIQSAMGSSFFIDVIYRDFEEIIDLNLKKYATTLNGKSINETDFSENALIILGNEGHGIRSEIIERCDEEVSIPGYSTSQDSLNIAISAALFCNEFRRQIPYSK